MDKLYIPGDLVMVKKSALQFAKDKIFKVISSLNGGFLKVVMLNDSSKTYSISNDAIRPIPITPEILEKNGWKRVDDEPINFEIEYFGTEFSNGVNIFYNVLTDIYRYDKHTILIYIHEIQHLLFGLGLNHKMKVC